MSARHWHRIAPLVGLAAGLWAFVGMAVPTARAAAPTMTVDMGSSFVELASAVSRVGLACAHELGGLGIALGFDSPSSGASATATPLPAVGLMVMGLLAVVAVALGRMKLQTEQRRLEVVRRLVEQGLTPPTPLLEGPARQDRRKGIVLLFAGAGLVAAGVLLGDRGIAAGGLVPAFIGIGYLVSHRLATAPPERTESS